MPAEEAGTNLLSWLWWALSAAYLLGMFWWNKQIREAKDEQLKAKDGELKAKDGELKAGQARSQGLEDQLKFYQNLTPKALLDNVTALKTLFEDQIKDLESELTNTKSRLDLVSRALDEQKAETTIAREKVEGLEREKASLEQKIKDSGLEIATTRSVAGKVFKTTTDLIRGWSEITVLDTKKGAELKEILRQVEEESWKDLEDKTLNETLRWATEHKKDQKK